VSCRSVYVSRRRETNFSAFCNATIPTLADVECTLYNCMLEILGSYLGRDTGNPD
jgi:hypothetical protein